MFPGLPQFWRQAEVNTDESTKTHSQNRVVETPKEEVTKGDVTKGDVLKKKCPECNRTYDCEDKLLRHVRFYHKGENPYQCSMCDYTTYNSILFKDHVNIHKGIKPYKCNFCPFLCVSKKNLQTHQKRHSPSNPLSCKVEGCGFLARTAHSFAVHMSEVHANMAASTNKMMKCKKCFFETNVEELFSNHPHFQCDVCKKLFYSSNIYEAHVSSVCVNSKRERFDKDKVSKGKIKKDKKKHSFSFTCAVCKWMTNSKQKALLHLIHHPKQKVDQSELDISILRDNGIMS